MPWQQVTRIISDTLRGLAVAHDRGLVHRDIKPANLWLEDHSARVKVLDFGLARRQDSSDRLTADGAVVGTPAHMSPEHVTGDPVDSRTDLFNVGTVMYQLMAGKSPILRGSLTATTYAVMVEPYPPMATVRTDVPKEYSDFLDRLLEKRPSGRPINARAALEEIAGIEKKLQEAAINGLSSAVEQAEPVMCWNPTGLSRTALRSGCPVECSLPLRL